MEREIKFRGKNVIGQWVYGSLIVDAVKGYCQIYSPITNDYLFAANATIGQFTGLCDKDGKEIYEGDIVRFVSKSLNETRIGIVRQFEWANWALDINGRECHIEKAVKYGNVIGNIHDNPELLTN